MKAMKIPFLFLVTLLSTISTTQAQWIQINGPYGGSIYSLAVSGTNLFAGTGRGVWRRPLNEMIPTGVEAEKSNLLTSFALEQNYPNPFNPETTISYQLSQPSHARITIRNTLGHEINKLVDRNQAAGRYSVPWNGRDFSGKKVASGIYFYMLEANNVVLTKKLVLLQ